MKKEIQFRQCNHIYSIDEENPKAGNLFLGSVGALKPEILAHFSIGSVLTIMDEYMYGKYIIPDKMKQNQIATHMHLIEDDSETADISKHFKKAHEFIDENLKTRNVLVHCQAGVSRSATIVISYIMKELKLTAQQGGKYVRSRRYVVSPNQGFWQSLEKYEEELKKTNKFKSKIPQFDSKYMYQEFYSKFCNHIACFHEGSTEVGNLFLGQATAICDNTVKKYKITAILTLLDEGFYNRLQIKPKIQHLNIPSYKWVKIKDNTEANILEILEECHQFISQNLSTGNVLVHCQMGVSRSASVVVSYLMRSFETDYYDALNHVRERRPQVKLNSGFETQIRNYSKKI